MIVDSLILFFVAFLAGYSFYFIPGIKEKNFSYVLVFAGAYLFSITIIHILPEVYSQFENPFQIGIYVLIGFFLQMILGGLSSGVEHGHNHIHHKSGDHMNFAPITLLIGLGVHSFLEGTVLAHPVRVSLHNHSGGILLGILLHKIPAAIALVTVLNHYFEKKKKTLIYLIIFSLCSPLGLLATSLLGDYRVFSIKEMSILYAVVSGSFLHISTTIFLESNPQHRFKLKRLGFLLLGGFLAVFIEMVF